MISGPDRAGKLIQAAVVGATTLLYPAAINSIHAAPVAATGKEDIFILRSIREQHAPADGWCSASKTGFEPFAAEAERFFSFWSLRVGADGKVTGTKRRHVAELRACFGATAEPARQNFYAEIKMGSVSFHGNGECLALKSDFPEGDLYPVRCQLVLSGLPPPYVGGLLTTNTITSKAAFGGETSPRGYTQASIATIRLWKSK